MEKNKISRLKLYNEIKQLPNPVQAHLKRCKKLAAYILERISGEDWFLDLKLNPKDIISAIGYHDIGKCRIPKDCLYLEHCTNSKKEQYYSHIAKGVAIVEELNIVDLSECKENEYGGMLYQAITGHHKTEEFKELGFTYKIPFVANLCLVVDKFDNTVFVGTSGNVDFKKNILMAKEQLESGYDQKIVSVLFDDVNALTGFAEYINMLENVNRKRDRRQYGICLRFAKIMDIAHNKEVGFRIKPIVNDPYYGILKTEQIIPIAEKTKQIFRFEKIAFEKLCILLETVDIRGLATPRITFPVSAYSLQKKSFIKEIAKLIKKYKIKSEFLCFGVSESSLIETNINLENVINDFHTLGCVFEINNFGEQISLLNNTGKYHIDRIAFKPSYGASIATDSKLHSIVSGVVSITSKLDISASFDGICTQAAELAVVKMGVKYASGDRYGGDLTDKEFFDALS